MWRQAHGIACAKPACQSTRLEQELLLDVQVETTLEIISLAASTCLPHKVHSACDSARTLSRVGKPADPVFEGEWNNDVAEELK